MIYETGMKPDLGEEEKILALRKAHEEQKFLCFLDEIEKTETKWYKSDRDINILTISPHNDTAFL